MQKRHVNAYTYELADEQCHRISARIAGHSKKEKTVEKLTIKTWTVKNNHGDIIANNILDIDSWLKGRKDVFVIAQYINIKEIIIEAPKRFNIPTCYET